MRKSLLFVVFSFIALGLGTGCTRKSESSQSLKLTFNSSKGQGAQSLTGNLEFAVVNVQLPTGPIVKQFEFDDNPLPAGQSLTVEVDLKNVPKGATFLVQFLGVFRTDGQPSVVAYDDALATNSIAVNEVTLNAAQIGSFTREGRVAGRYISQISPETGPTGTLVMQYRPPGWPTVPKLSIEKSSMVDGWFNLLALDGAAMDYVLLESGEVLFSQLQLTGTQASGQLSINGSGMSPSSATIQLARFTVPASYRQRGQSKVDPRGPEETWIGYLVKPGLSGVTSKKVCVPNDVVEGTNYFADATLTTRIDMDLAGSGAGIVRHVGGGSTFTSTQIYDGTATGCYTVAAADRIPVYHTLLSSDGDRAAGIEPPFKAVKPFARWDNFIRASYTASPSEINLSWAYLPGATSFDGVVIFGKNSTSGGSSGDSCDQLSGYSELATVAAAATSYNFPVAANSQYGWQFALCAFKADGGRRWISRPVHGGQLGNWDQIYHTGWARASQTATGVSSENMASHAGEPIHKVADVDSVASTFFTNVTLGSSVSSLAAGDEVLLTVVGRGSSTDCGTYNGVANDVGSFGFARVISASGSTLKIQKDSWADSLDPVAASTFTTAAAPASTFCYVAVQRVPHYSTFNLGSTSSFTGGGFFDMAGTGGMVTAFRVNGTLTLGTTSFDADGMGYQGAQSSPAPKGGGIRGPVGSTATDTGGQGGTDGSGGGGWGNGATTDVGGGQSWVGPSNSSARFVFGGGGGLGGGSNYGGNGGGIIFISARNVHLTGTPTFKASGTSGLSSYGGGGGGGSIVLNIGTLTRSAAQVLNLTANGGIGGGASNGGKGGGGYVNIYVCDTTLASGTDIVSSVLPGSSGAGTGAQSGHSQIQTGTASSGGYCSVN